MENIFCQSLHPLLLIGSATVPVQHRWGGSPLFLDQTEARRAEKTFLRPPPPLSQSRDDRPPLSECQDLPPWNTKQVKHQTEVSS